MLSKWTEILPLFIIRWLSLRLCEKISINEENNQRTVAIARPDVLIKVPRK